MKKALALVLALVLALSMAVSAFALDMVELDPADTASDEEIDIEVIDAADTVLYVYEGGEYYFALEDAAWEDIKITTNGNVDAELVEYDPETMNVYGMEIVFDITEKGEAMGDPHFFTADGVGESTDKYEVAVEYAEDLNDAAEVTYYDVEVRTNVNIIKVTVEDNYTAHYTEGTIKVEAKLDDEKYVGEIEIINDVFNFEYEELKWTAKNYNAKFEKSEKLYVGQEGYSDYVADLIGYDYEDADYDEEANRYEDYAAVVSTTGFRAITGKNLVVVATDNMYVTLKDIVSGQKGVNFKAYTDIDFEDDNENDVRDWNEDVNAIEFGFYGDQIVKGEFEITIDLGVDYFELREMFGFKVEEDDIITYYVVDAKDNVVKTIKVDYMTADIDENVDFTISGEGKALGQYKLVVEVGANEVEGEENPNTGAESVVGVVAALAVVSAATAAAVSLKK